MLLKFRGKVEDVVREILAAHPAISHPMPTDPIQQPPSVERRELFDRVVALREQQEQELPPLRAQAARLEANLSEALAQVEELERQLTDVRGHEFIRNLSSRSELDRVLNHLHASASPLIVDFLVEMNKELDDLRRLKPQYTREAGELDLITMIKPKYCYSDGPDD